MNEFQVIEMVGSETNDDVEWFTEKLLGNLLTSSDEWELASK